MLIRSITILYRVSEICMTISGFYTNVDLSRIYGCITQMFGSV